MIEKYIAPESTPANSLNIKYLDSLSFDEVLKLKDRIISHYNETLPLSDLHLNKTPELLNRSLDAQIEEDEEGLKSVEAEMNALSSELEARTQLMRELRTYILERFRTREES